MAAKKTASVTSDVNTSTVTPKGDTIVISKIFDSKPSNGQLAAGEVGSYKNSSGKTIYVVGAANGTLAANTSDISTIAKKVESVYTKIESIKLDQLKANDKIEIAELKSTLKAEGVPASEINKIVDNENAANKVDYAAYKKAVSPVGFQTVSRDATNGLIGTNATLGSNNEVSSWGATPKSLLTSTLDPAVSAATKTAFNNAQSNINSSFDNIAQVKLSYGLPADYYTSGENTKSGISSNAIYSAMKNGLLSVNPTTGNYEFNKETKPQAVLDKVDPNLKSSGNTNALGITTPQTAITVSVDSKTGALIDNGIFGIKTIPMDTIKKTWVLSPDGKTYYPPNTTFKDVPKYDIKTELNKIGGTGFTREMLNLLSRDTVVGDKAFTKVVDGQVYVTGENGELTGKNKPLVDTGKTTSNGLKLFTQDTTVDTKYNKVGMQSLYVQNPDGSYTYMGTPSASYTEIPDDDGFDIGGFVLSVAASFIAGPEMLGGWVAGQLGVSTVVGSAIAGAVLGGTVAGITGNNVVDGALMAGISTGAGTFLKEAAKSAGGWGNLLDQVQGGNFDAFKNVNVLSAGTTAADVGSKVAESVVANGGTTAQAVDTANNVVANQAATGATTGATTGAGLLENVDNATNLAQQAVAEGTKVNLANSGTLLNQGTGLLSDAQNAANAGLTLSQYATLMNQPINLANSGTLVPSNTGTGLVNPPNISDYSNPNTTYAQDLYNNAVTQFTQPIATSVAPEKTMWGDIKDAWNTLPAWGQAALVGGAGTLAKDAITGLLTTTPKEQTYPSFTLKNPTNAGAGTLPTNMPDWWNNLYARQGVGAGNYLGYDVMKGLNVPADVLSLLGTSAPQVATIPTTTTV